MNRLVLECVKAKLASWEKKVGAAMRGLDEEEEATGGSGGGSEVSKMLRTQHATEVRLLGKLRDDVEAMFEGCRRGP